MSFRVVISPQAEQDIVDAFAHIERDAPDTAARWLNEMYGRIADLDVFPSACPVAPETQFIGEEVRHITFKSHRIIFRIESRTQIVRVLYVRHAARRAKGEPMDDDHPPAE